MQQLTGYCDFEFAENVPEINTGESGIIGYNRV